MTKPRRYWHPAKGQGEGIRFLREHVNHEGVECLLWPLSCDDKGYAIVSINGRVSKAARIMCELVNGPPPTPKHESAHSCGHGHLACVHPKHVLWKTRAANQQDRRKHGTAGRPGVIGRSKLTPQQIAEIRSLTDYMTQRELAAKFNCHPSNISKILNGARWQKTPDWLRAGLTFDDLEAIRRAKGIEPGTKLAARYGVDKNVIWRIQNGRAYTHIRPRETAR